MSETFNLALRSAAKATDPDTWEAMRHGDECKDCSDFRRITTDNFADGLKHLGRLGWKIVGPEPTDAMEKAGYEVLCSDDAPSIDSPQHWESYISPKIWKARFAASPSIDELLEGEK